MNSKVAPASLSTYDDGFTLLELIVALALFSLILSFAYQALVTSVDVHSRVSDSISSQEQLRIAHRTLRNAVGSGGRISGTSGVLEIDLDSATTQWSLNARFVSFQIRNGNELWQFVDKQVQGELLLNASADLTFGYLNQASDVYLNWNENTNPQAVSLGNILNDETAGRQTIKPMWLLLTQ